MCDEQTKEFWRCLRCNSYLTANTSTAKRYHNVKCLSNAAKHGNNVCSASYILQGYEKEIFVKPEVSLKRLTASDTLKAIEPSSSDHLIECKPCETTKTRKRNVHLQEIFHLPPRRSNLAAKERIKKASHNFTKDGDKNRKPELKKKTIDGGFKSYVSNSLETIEAEVTPALTRKPGRPRKESLETVPTQKYTHQCSRMQEILHLPPRRANLAAKEKIKRTSHNFDEDDDKNPTHKLKKNKLDGDFKSYVSKNLETIKTETTSAPTRKRGRPRKESLETVPTQEYTYQCTRTYKSRNGLQTYNYSYTKNYKYKYKSNYKPKKVRGAIFTAKVPTKYTRAIQRTHKLKDGTIKTYTYKHKFDYVYGSGSYLDRYKSEMATCDICGTSVRATYLQKHQESHTKASRPRVRKNNSNGNDTFKCVICDKAYMKRESIKFHFVSTHMEKNPYCCQFEKCSFKGGDYNELEKHVSVHVVKDQCDPNLANSNSRRRRGRRRKICNVVNSSECTSTTSPNFDEEAENDIISCTQLDTVTVTRVELERVNLTDKLIKTEDGPEFVTEEQSEVGPIIKQEYVDPEPLPISIGEIKSENVPSQPTNYYYLSEPSIRERVRKIMLSWNENLFSGPYLYNLIQEDPLFQKLKEEHPDFCKILVPKRTLRHFLSTAFKCPHCFATFFRSYQLQYHLRHKCSKKVAPEISLVDKTQNGEGKDSLSLMCLTCGYQSTSSKDLKKHMKTTPNHRSVIKNCQCPFCKGWFKSTADMNKHIDQFHLAKPNFKCNLCPKVYTTEKSLSKHKILHTQRYTCKNCPRQFRILKNCESHEKLCVTNKFKPKCYQCEEHFATKTTLQRHVLYVHANRLKPTSSQTETCNNAQNNVSSNANPEISASDCDKQSRETDHVDESMILGM